MIDAKPEHLEIIKAILDRYAPETEARVFGSRVNGTARKYSDIDIALVGSVPLPWRSLAALKDAFEESNLPYEVDMLDWHTIPDDFKKNILRRYEILTVRENADTAP